VQKGAHETRCGRIRLVISRAIHPGRPAGCRRRLTDWSLCSDQYLGILLADLRGAVLARGVTKRRSVANEYVEVVQWRLTDVPNRQ
jgi:hypothetical protein